MLSNKFVNDETNQLAIELLYEDEAEEKNEKPDVYPAFSLSL